MGHCTSKVYGRLPHFGRLLSTIAKFTMGAGCFGSCKQGNGPLAVQVPAISAGNCFPNVFEVISHSPMVDITEIESYLVRIYDIAIVCLRIFLFG